MEFTHIDTQYANTGNAGYTIPTIVNVQLGDYIFVRAMIYNGLCQVTTSGVAVSTVGAVTAPVTHYRSQASYGTTVYEVAVETSLVCFKAMASGALTVTLTRNGYNLNVMLGDLTLFASVFRPSNTSEILEFVSTSQGVDWGVGQTGVASNLELDVGAGSAIGVIRGSYPSTFNAYGVDYTLIDSILPGDSNGDDAYGDTLIGNEKGIIFISRTGNSSVAGWLQVPYTPPSTIFSNMQLL